MPVDRKRIINALSAYADPQIMKIKYGIILTKDQILAAQRVIQNYQRMTDAELKHMDEKMALKWPYTLTEEQKYDKIMHSAGPMTIPQTIVWQHIRSYLAKNTAERKTDGECILKALQDIEGFLQVNAYIGEFEENRKLIDGKDIPYIMRLFNTAYRKYQNQKL